MNVFLSYRRADTQHFCGRLADKLRHTPGISEVFLDVQSIPGGDDFKLAIARALRASSTCLVVIGTNWAGGGEPARIFLEHDFVHLEVRQALMRNELRVLPVLVDGATMPTAADLPNDLAPLLRINAIPMRHGSFDRDVAFLIDQMFSRSPPTGMRIFFARHPLFTLVVQCIASALASLLLLLMLVVVINRASGRSLDEFIGKGPTVLFILAATVGGALYPIFRRMRV